MEQDVEGADESGCATHGNVLSPLHYLEARVGSTCFIVLQTSLYACSALLLIKETVFFLSLHRQESSKLFGVNHRQSRV